MTTQFLGIPVPPRLPNELAQLADWLRKVQTIGNRLLAGKMHAVGSVTLTANVASTTVNDNRITPDSYIGFMPTTANAAAEIGAGGMYVGTRTAETSFVITHANNAQADRTFAYVVIG